MSDSSLTADDLAGVRARLADEMRSQGLVPLWEVYEKLVTSTPDAIPSVLWRWSDLERPLDLATTAVQGKDADHRVLVLKNPHIANRVATVTNILAAVQCVMPGEKTSAHRHTPSAVRIILEGAGGGTFVDGVRCAMHAGDLVTTPNWTWHNHDNDSAERAVWVDILDVPFVKAQNNVFGEYGQTEPPPATMATLPDEAFARGGIVPMGTRPATRYSPRFRYPATEVEAALDAMPPAPDGSRSVHYADPLSGGPVLPTLDVHTVRLSEGEPTAPLRESSSAICVVLDGEGRSTVGGVAHEWKARDIFTIPEWALTSHVSRSARSRLLVVSDRALREGLSLHRSDVA